MGAFHTIVQLGCFPVNIPCFLWYAMAWHEWPTHRDRSPNGYKEFYCWRSSDFISLCQPVSKQYWGDIYEVRGIPPRGLATVCHHVNLTTAQSARTAATPLVSLCNVKFQEMYNNIVIYIVGHPPEESPSPNEMHIFQCVNVSAR